MYKCVFVLISVLVEEEETKPGIIRIFPFSDSMSQATCTIIFDTKNHLGLNAGVLIAWIALSVEVVNITAITIFQRRKERRSFECEKAMYAYKEKLGTAVEGDVA